MARDGSKARNIPGAKVMLYIPVPINIRNHIKAAMSKRQRMVHYKNHGKSTWGEGESQAVRSKLLYEKKGK